MGLNLSDRVYLAGDTRVTHENGTYSDDALKMTPLLDRVMFPQNEIGMAVAGNVALATFLKDRISKGLQERVLSSDIRKFYAEIKVFLEAAITEWVDAGNIYVNCCLLFAGVFNGRQKQIDSEKLERLIEEFKKSKKHEEDLYHKSTANILNDPTLKILDEKIRAAQGRGLLDLIEMSRVPEISGPIKDALERNLPAINHPDSLVFSAQIEVATKTVKMEVAEWGEMLAYGAKVKKESIPNGLLANLELWYGKKPQEFLIETSILTTTILDYAKEHGVSTIGGTVLVMPINKKGASLTGKGIIFKERGTKVNINGVIMPLVPFFHYHKKKRADLNLVAAI